MAELSYLPIKTKPEIKAAIKEIAWDNRTTSSKWISNLLEQNAEIQREIKKLRKKQK